MRSLYSLLALVAFVFSACAPQPKALPTPIPTNTPFLIPNPTPISLPQRAPVLRVAILGDATTTNVWKLFDESGADYWNYVTQASYWPRLYQLAPLSLDFEPATAKGEPTIPECDTDVCIGTVVLKPNLKWSDGSPFTAEDVTFTVNIALLFRLGLNWQNAYNPDVLDHAEPLNKNTVKFYFKETPDVGDWQYGVLQGPIVNRAYWQPRIGDAVGLLPDEDLLPTIQQLEQEFATMQAEVDKLNLSLNTMAPASDVYQETSRQAQNLQDELNSIANKLEKNRTAYETALTAARNALFSLPNTGEPTLGAWQFTSRIEDSFENQVNLGTPFGDSWFDSVHYITYSDETAAVSALLDDEVDLVLTPDGLSSVSISALENDPDITLARNRTRSARFLAFNHTNFYLANPTLRQALACIIEPQLLVEKLDDEVAPLSSFVLDDFWMNANAPLPCAGLTGEARIAAAVELLKVDGYSWSVEPTGDTAGVGLVASDGSSLPRFTILAPLSSQDRLRARAAEVIAQQAAILDLDVDVQKMDHEALLYAVYGSGDYDMAMLGWRLSTYPAYLCGWFMPVTQSPLAYGGSKLESACEAWDQTNDLDIARSQALDIQSILSQDLPIIPLYSETRVDAYRNVSYPFKNVVDGLGGLYGAPSLAIPNPK